jgi:hypothetical protein
MRRKLRPATSRFGLALAIAGLGVLGTATASVAVSADPSTVYAAPAGHGTDCAKSAPCDLQRAKQTAKSRAEHQRDDIRVVLAGGTYTLTAPLSFGPQDSGRSGHRIIWEAAPGQKPVLSGGVPIAGFTPAAGSPGLWSAPAPDGLQTRQLYADGVRIPRSSAPSPVALTQTATGFQAASTPNWRNPGSVEFVFDGGNGAWTQPRCDVAKVDGTAITMRQPCWDNLHLPATPKAENGDNPAGGFPGLDAKAVPTTVENAFELLTPGHWYLDDTQHRVYYDARPGENPAGMNFVAPKLQQLLTTTSTADNPLHDVTFRGLTFSYATWLQPSGDDGFAEMQANMTLTGPNAANTQGLCQYVTPKGTCPFAAWTRPPAAVDLTGTEGVDVLGNTFTHLGSAGLGVQHGIRGDLIDGNEVTDVSGIGILFGAVDDPQPTSTTELAHGPRKQIDLGAKRPLWTIGVSTKGTWVFVSDKPFDTTLTPEEQAATPGVWSARATTTEVPADTSGRYLLAVGGDITSVHSGAEIATGNTVSHNYIHDTGVEYTGAPGIVAGYSRQTTISHNELADLPYSGISFGFGGWHTDAVTPDANPNINADNVIADNLIYHVMEVRADGGPIYTNGPQGKTWDHGLTIRGNVTFANKATSFASYNDEGSAYITMDGNVQYKDSGNFNGGCSTVGHIIVRNNYRVGPLNVYICNRVGTDFIDGGGNVLLPQNPGPAELPAAAISGAGLSFSYAGLTSTHRPVVAAVSPIEQHQVLVSGSGFTTATTAALEGHPAGHVEVLSPNQLIATFPVTVPEGNVTVTTAAGTSAVTADSDTYDPGDDLALKHEATQSSTAFGSPAANAVDGITDGNYARGSLSHTDLDAQAWWQVDLGKPAPIGQINLYNRTDCCSDRLTDYWVFVSDQPFDSTLSPAEQAARPGVWSSHQTGTAGTPTRLLPSATGRYVRVQLAGTNYLALAEVQVFGAA